MNENVLATIFLLDETEALRVVEPFDSSLNHKNKSFVVVVTTASGRFYEGLSEGAPKGVTEECDREAANLRAEDDKL